MTGAAPTTSEPVGGAKALRVAIAGASGRMGRMLIQTIHATEGAVLGGALERAGSLALGQDAGLLSQTRDAVGHEENENHQGESVDDFLQPLEIPQQFRQRSEYDRSDHRPVHADQTANHHHGKVHHKLEKAESVRDDEPECERKQPSSDSGVKRAQRKYQKLCPCNIDSAALGNDLVFSQGDERPPKA